MDNNYLLHYDQVVAYYDQYIRVNNNILKSFTGATLMLYLNPIKWWKETRSLYKTIKQVDPLSGRLPEYYLDLNTRYATTEQKENLYFKILNSQYPLDSLASGLLEQFPNLDYEKLKKVHDMRKEILVRTDFVGPGVGFILAASAILLRTVPKSVVEQAMDYPSFELNVFLLTVSSIALLLLMFLPVWIKYNRAKKRSKYIGDLLVYAALKKSDHDK